MASRNRRRTEANLHLLIDRLYGASTDEDAWKPALESLVELVGGSGAFMMASDPTELLVKRSYSVGMDLADTVAYQSHWFTQDVRMPRAFVLPTMQPMSEADLVAPSELRGSAIFNDFLLPSDIPHILAIWLDKGPRRAASISLQRNRAQGAFTSDQGDLLTRVAPHIRRALQIKDRLAATSAKLAGLLAAMDALPFALFLIDAHGTILEASRTARQHLANRHGIFSLAGQLRCTDSACDRRLQQDIRRAIQGESSSATPVESLRVTTPSRPGSLVLSVLPIARDDAWISTGRASGIVLAFADWETPAPTPEILGRLYRLTPAESALTCLLVSGSSLAEAADQLQIAVSTARTQIKSVFAKVGARSQADLIRLLLTGTARRDPGVSSGSP